MDRAALRDHVLAHSVKRGSFTLKSGKPTSWFLDTKQTACRPDGIVLVADAALEAIPPETTAIGGTSALEAVAVVRAYGAEVVMILALVDRGGTAAALAAAEGVEFVSLLSAPDLGFPFDA